MGEIVLEVLLEVLFYMLLYPLAAILSTPVILVAATWGENSYFANVKDYYGRVFNWLGRRAP